MAMQFMIVVLLMFTISFPLLVVGFVRNNLLVRVPSGFADCC